MQLRAFRQAVTNAERRASKKQARPNRVTSTQEARGQRSISEYGSHFLAVLSCGNWPPLTFCPWSVGGNRIAQHMSLLRPSVGQSVMSYHFLYRPRPPRNCPPLSARASSWRLTMEGTDLATGVMILQILNPISSLKCAFSTHFTGRNQFRPKSHREWFGPHMT